MINTTITPKRPARLKENVNPKVIDKKFKSKTAGPKKILSEILKTGNISEKNSPIIFPIIDPATIRKNIIK